MAKKVEVTTTRIEQFNKMVEMLRTIRRYDVKHRVAELKAKRHKREQALEIVLNEVIRIATYSRGIAEIQLPK